jgi:hypothetical protein
MNFQRCALLILALLSLSVNAESAEPVVQDTLNSTDQTSKLTVYLDTDNLDYFIQELGWVNFVRDPVDADVHLIHASQSTASGGEEATVRFIGQRVLSGMCDTLTYTLKPDETEDVERSKLLQTIQLGLVRYLAKSGQGDNLEVTYTAVGKSEPPIDKWDHWVYKFYFYGYFQGESSLRKQNLYSYISANRITEDWKILLSVNGSENESLYELDDGDVISRTASRGIAGTVVKSLGEHWSARLDGGVNSSTYKNQDISTFLAPGVEYNIFPYSESSSKQLRLQYELRHKYFEYHEETIFFRTSETRFAEAFTTALELVQPWGTSSLYLEFFHYFHDFEKLRLYANLNLEFRLFEGLSLEIWSNASMIRDQLSLPRSGATEEEILLQRRELETNYEYYSSIGLSYTFGSIYSSVVNPRFGD